MLFIFVLTHLPQAAPESKTRTVVCVEWEQIRNIYGSNLWREKIWSNHSWVERTIYSFIFHV